MRAKSTLFLSVFWNFDRGNSSKSKIWHHQLVRRYQINLEQNLLRFLTKFPYSNGQKTSKNAPKIGQKTVFCDFDRGNSVLLSPNHFKSILWSKIGIGKCIRSVWCTEQKIPVRASTKRNPYIYSLVKAQRAHRPIFSELEGLEPWLVSHVDVLMVATDWRH